MSCTHYLGELDAGRCASPPAPPIARHCWKLPDTATLRDVILVVRADEAHHRDVNHAFANELSGVAVGKGAIAPYPEHAADLEQTA